MINFSGGAIKFILQIYPLKMQGTENRIDFLRFAGGNKISSVHVAFIAFSFHEDST